MLSRSLQSSLEGDFYYTAITRRRQLILPVSFMNWRCHVEQRIWEKGNEVVGLIRIGQCLTRATGRLSFGRLVSGYPIHVACSYGSRTSLR